MIILRSLLKKDIFFKLFKLIRFQNSEYVSDKEAILWYYFIFIKRTHYIMKRTTLILLLIISLSSVANALTRYVSDDLYTYMHTGPGTKYKIIGSVNSGEKIKVLKTNKNAGFTQIKDSKGRTGWIRSKYTSRQPGLKERLEKLEVKFTNLKAQLHTAKEKANTDIANLEDNVNSHSNKVRKLQSTNTKLNKQLQQIQALNDNLNEKLDTKKTDLLIRWFTYGGMVAGAGLLLGLILPSLIPNRRKRNRW